VSSLKLFWWAPARDPRLAWPEVKANPAVWLRLAARTGRLATNFGDELSSHVVEAVTGRNVKWASPQQADLVAVGSVLGLYASQGSGAAVWGSGIREPEDAHASKNLVSKLGPILAVRGVKTRAELGLSESTPLGDPGVLAPMFRTPRQTGQRSVLAIPHFRAWSSPSGRETLKLLVQSGIKIAEPTLHPKTMIDRICGASLVLTSSLHGLILGHSLGVPTQLVSWNNHGAHEPDFKYADYASSLNHSISAVSITEALDPQKLRVLHENSEKDVDKLATSTASLAEGLVKAIASL
jgi:pyruvyltransferase